RSTSSRAMRRSYSAVPHPRCYPRRPPAERLPDPAPWSLTLVELSLSRPSRSATRWSNSAARHRSAAKTATRAACASGGTVFQRDAGIGGVGLIHWDYVLTYKRFGACAPTSAESIREAEREIGTPGLRAMSADRSPHGIPEKDGGCPGSFRLSAFGPPF